MTGTFSTFIGLFSGGEATSSVHAVRIPMFQRDYAQGRQDLRSAEVRAAFVNALREPLAGGDPIGLDFIYGEKIDGVLEPLDGQQRLTTLFLLHVYLAQRAGSLSSNSGWVNFTYETRPSARTFCERLVEFAPPPECANWASWLRDQPWFLHTWSHDPTIQGMLTTLGEIETQFADLDPSAAWARLSDTSDPPISFQVLLMDEMGSSAELYLKMNSRGKPLTPFENFKARFEKAMAPTGRGSELAHRIDGPWSDLLWPLHGGDDIVDDEFMHYLNYIVEVREWVSNLPQHGSLDERAERVFTDSVHGAENLDYLFDAFDTWRSLPPSTTDRSAIEVHFDSLFSLKASRNDGATLLWQGDPQLFTRACRLYGGSDGGQTFSLSQTLLLHAVLTHRRAETPDASGQLRALRNLVEASNDEIRRENMPTLLRETEGIMRGEPLEKVRRFNQRQVADEIRKRDAVEAIPEIAETIRDLEDHDLLRGSLVAFKLDATLPERAAAFRRAFDDSRNWSALSAAFLRFGDYQRRLPSYRRRFQFGTAKGTQSGVWRTVLTDATFEGMGQTRAVLASLLDYLIQRPGENTLIAITTTTEAWMLERQNRGELDWRYYLIKYAEARDGDSGLYVSDTDDMGVELRMLTYRHLNSYYRDPLLSAMWVQALSTQGQSTPWFLGADPERWAVLPSSGAYIRNVSNAIEVDAPDDPLARGAFETYCRTHPELIRDEDCWYLPIPQRESDAGLVDTEDRVELGAWLIDSLESLQGGGDNR